MGKRVKLYCGALVASAFISVLEPFAAEPAAETRPATNAPPPAIATPSSEFLVEQGFRMELVADDSLVSSPAAMAFDENGRLFVAEMRDYPDRRDQNPHLGRIRLLEDTNGDGKFDRSRVFAENVAWPSAIACSGGGIFVAATPEILFIKEPALGGGEVRKVVFNGVGAGKPLRADALLNSFAWGPDNRIHVGTAGLGGTLSGVDLPNAVGLELGGNDFAFDPRAMTVVSDPGSAQSGMCFDDFGRRFFCELARPVRTAMYDVRYTARNPFFVRAPGVTEVMNPAPIFRYLFADQAADPAQARLATPAGAPTGFGALTSGWSGLARGATVYRGALFPAEYLGNIFVADPKAGVIHRALVRETGLDLSVVRPPNEVSSEFVISKDPLFHPSQIINGPEGALYVADMRDGQDHGRIYRIAPSNFQASHLPLLGQAKTYDLVAFLAQTNGWLRDTCSRLLYERHDPGSVALLTNMLNNSRIPAARVQAL
jgi:putative membrane-bound dehydrogenase-like protein